MKVLFYGFKVEKQNFVIVVVLALCSLCTDFFGLILCFQNYTFNDCKMNGMSQYVVCLEYSYVSIYNKALRSCIYICMYVYLSISIYIWTEWADFFRGTLNNPTNRGLKKLDGFFSKIKTFFFKSLFFYYQKSHSLWFKNKYLLL